MLKREFAIVFRGSWGIVAFLFVTGFVLTGRSTCAQPPFPSLPAQQPAPEGTAPATAPSDSPSAGATRAETPPTSADTDQVTMSTLEDLKKRVESSGDLQPEQVKSLLDLLEQARADLVQSAEYAANFKAWQQQATEIESARQRAQASLEAAQRESPQTFQDLETLSALEQALASKQQDLVHAQNELAQTEKRINDRALRQKNIKERLAAIPGELEANTVELSRLGAGDEPSISVLVRRFRLLAQRKKLENESPAIQAQAALLSAQEAANLIQLARNEWTVRVARLREEVAYLQREVLRRRSKDAKDRSDVARADAEYSSIPLIKDIYHQNVEIVEEEISFREREKRLKEQIADAEAITNWLMTKHKDLANRQEKIGSNKAFGIRLRNEGKLLPDLRTYRDQIAERTQLSQEAQMELIDVASRINMLSRLDHRVSLAMQQIFPGAAMGELSDDRQLEYNQVARDVRRAYEQQQKYLTELQSANESYVSALDELDAQQQQLINAAESFQKFIVENILWVPTSSLLRIQDVIHDRASLLYLFGTTEWIRLADEYRKDAFVNPAVYIAALLVWVTLLVTQRQQRKYIISLGQKAASRLNTSMQPTWEAIFWTTLKSLVWPFPLFFLAWRGKGLSSDTALLSGYVLTITIWLYWLELVRNTCRDRGLGVAHFQWPERVNRVVMVQLSSLIMLATPVILAAVIILSRTPDQEALPLERTCGVVFYLLLAYALHRLTSKKTGILREWNELHPGSWSAQLSPVWHLIAVSLPLFLAGLTIAGYTYAAGQLSVRLAQSLMVVFGALFAKATFIRWLTLRHRRLAIEHAREVRAALAESNPEEEGRSATKLEAQEARTNLVEVSMQSKRVLNTTVLVASLVWIWYIWIDVLPALQRLDQYPIPLLGLSVAKVLFASFVAILFATAARNIPGLVEMLLLERLPLDRSVRYAIGSLTRYAIVVVGIYVFGLTIGISWENVQWLVAALTFGLGFGLQEIFANFISGLIILFEQPVRVGDVVTIDSVTGSVSRIRIRSTTIVDWDRKEYIVPNKEFITGKLLNWTLTDTTNRFVLNVDVALNSDPVQVREVLLKVICSQQHVMTDPAPMVIFDGFVSGAMRFVIRAYLPNMEHRAETMHQTYVRIVQAFAEAGIVIPVPQRDLLLRTASPISVQQSREDIPKSPSVHQGNGELAPASSSSES